jgi:hypothetical protein
MNMPNGIINRRKLSLTHCGKKLSLLKKNLQEKRRSKQDLKRGSRICWASKPTNNRDFY